MHPQMQLAALQLLAAVAGAPGNPFVSDWAAVSFYGQRNFVHFARLFHDLPEGGAPLSTLCKAHLQARLLHQAAFQHHTVPCEVVICQVYDL